MGTAMGESEEFPLGSAAYNLALQNITDQFSKCGTNTSRPNQSSLNALRTNEIALVLPTSINPQALGVQRVYFG